MVRHAAMAPMTDKLRAEPDALAVVEQQVRDAFALKGITIETFDIREERELPGFPDTDCPLEGTFHWHRFYRPGSYSDRDRQAHMGVEFD